MGLSDNLKNLTNQVQQGTRVAAVTLSQRVLRLLSGLLIGLVLSLIIQVFAQSGTLMLVFFITLFTVIIYRLLRRLTIFQIFIFDVICILVATLLRMYIIIAP